MPAIKQVVTHAAAETVPNALDGLRFDTLLGPALITLFASASAVAHTISFAVGDQEFIVDAAPNIEVANEAVDCEGRDLILSREPVNLPGKMFMRMVAPAVGTTQYWLNIENVPV